MQISIMPLSRSGSVSNVSRWSTAPQEPEHPGAAGAAETLLARVRRMHASRGSAPTAASRRRRPAPSRRSRRPTPRTPCRRRPAARRTARNAARRRRVPTSADRIAVSIGAGPHAYTAVPSGQSPSRSAAVGRPLTSSVRIAMRSPKRLTSSMNGRLSRLRPAYTIDQSTPRRCGERRASAGSA